MHDHTSYHSLCFDTIGVEGRKVCLHPIRDCEVQAHSAPGRWKPFSDGIYFIAPPRENFDYCAPVGDVVLSESHQDLVVSFVSSSPSERTLDLEIWENTGKRMRRSRLSVV